MTEYKTIDLGLPSGILWADRNVVAESPESIGHYFAWGETKPRGEKWATEAPYDWAHAPFNDGATAFNETYFNEHKSEWLTENETLKPEYDAATQIMGGSWRMPTSADILELLTGTRSSVEMPNGITGIRFASKANGNSIFMPFAGYRIGSDVNPILVGVNGNAWSSSLRTGRAGGYSHSLNFYNLGYADVYSNIRYLGFVVRGVCI